MWRNLQGQTLFTKWTNSRLKLSPEFCGKTLHFWRKLWRGYLYRTGHSPPRSLCWGSHSDPQSRQKILKLIKLSSSKLEKFLHFKKAWREEKQKIISGSNIKHFFITYKSSYFQIREPLIRLKEINKDSRIELSAFRASKTVKEKKILFIFQFCF